MEDFKREEGCPRGDPDYVWGDEGAEIMTDETYLAYFVE